MVLFSYDDGSGFTALHFAAALGSKQLIDLLIEQDYRIGYLAHVKSQAGKLPLQLAIEGKHDDTAKALLERMELNGYEQLLDTVQTYRQQQVPETKRKNKDIYVHVELIYINE